eukprot:CAMPEP_0204907012 /NCGR_PEP_ID=MMETSP1397-20131031/6275_1 /ASSEMBLY_ACC=CAM_ASM_000891 /TAXON_ID=49980 /ORGANISM="Climacostomum Climacostomum virens, Strain Stock W-24" /LENGTH=159 /DNA_ID=CAMNT_0052076027 /DNA_START=64 /DNA_END=543 /DNA_ORIENTATION=-
MPPIVTLLQSPGDLIVLVEERWKYKKDITGLLGVKHTYVVTTTQNGERKRWDKIHSSPPERCLEYPLEAGNRSFLHRRTLVEPSVTEAELARRVQDQTNDYDFLTSNCQHHSDKLYTMLTKSSSYPLNPWMLNLAEAFGQLVPQQVRRTVQATLFVNQN